MQLMKKSPEIKKSNYAPSSTEYKILHKDCVHSSNIENNERNQLKGSKWKICSLCGPSIIPITVALGLIFIIFFWPLNMHEENEATEAEIKYTENKYDRLKFEVNNCNIQLVESIPDGLNFSQNSPTFMSTYDAWKTLLDLAGDSVNIGSFYWTLRGSDVVNHSTAAPGEDIFQRILSNGNDQRLKIKIAQSIATPNTPNVNTQTFVKYGAAKVRSVDFPRLLGGGVLHTKLWIVDNKHFYLGSANMDWRSLTQVKELGVLAQNCSGLVNDLIKIFNTYWYLGTNTSTIPNQWPNEYSTRYNWKNPMIVNFNNNYKMSAIFSNSPPPLSANGRQNDLDAILNTISSAKSFVNIAVMDYFPLLIYTKRATFWPYIDDALRAAAINNGVAIKMLISWWPHSRQSEDYFLRSLSSLSESLKGVDIQIRRFVVPSNEDQKKIPFGRVNHNKYMVTDNTAYIGTSNWSGDYFTDTAGIGLVMRDIAATNANSPDKARTTARTELLSVFERDWQSPYAVELHKDDLI